MNSAGCAGIYEPALGPLGWYKGSVSVKTDCYLGVAKSGKATYVADGGIKRGLFRDIEPICLGTNASQPFRFIQHYFSNVYNFPGTDVVIIILLWQMCILTRTNKHNLQTWPDLTISLNHRPFTPGLLIENPRHYFIWFVSTTAARYRVVNPCYILM